MNNNFFDQSINTSQIKLIDMSSTKKPKILYRYAMMIAAKWSAEGFNFKKVLNKAFFILANAYDKDNLKYGNWKELEMVGNQLLNQWPPEIKNTQIDAYGIPINETFLDNSKLKDPYE